MRQYYDLAQHMNLDKGSRCVSIWERIKDNKGIVIIVATILTLGIGYTILSHEKEAPLLPLVEQENTTEVDSKAEEHIEVNIPNSFIIVDVKGAVKRPGVYELNERSRVIDAIQIAGGTLADANLDEVNQAAFLKDGQVVYVPMIGEEPNIWSNQSYSDGAGTTSSYVNINTATLNELQTLPGIGPSKSQAIISYREENGPFAEPKDLIKVSGIGQKTLEKLLPLITVR